jgi:hypothetical protein
LTPRIINKYVQLFALIYKTPCLVHHSLFITSPIPQTATHYS